MPDSDNPSAARRMVLSALRAIVTLSVIGAAALGVLMGQEALSSRLSAAEGPAPAPATAVAVAAIEMQESYQTERRFAGQFEPRQEVALAFEEGGTIAEIMIEEGDRVSEGDVIARLDTRLLEAERERLRATRAALEAQVELARRTNGRQAELRERGFATDQTVDDTSLSLVRLEAGRAEVDAAIAALDVRLSKAVLSAPFDGPVGDRVLDEGAVAGPGAPVVTLLQDGPVLFRASLDPALAEALSPGERVEIRAGDDLIPARLERLAPELEAATRARAAFFAVEGAAPPSGTAGEVRLSRAIAVPGEGAWVPLSALRQGPRGTWQLTTVEEGPDGPIAGTEAVEILHAEGGRAFVAGTIRDGAVYVPEGTHRIVPGERLRPATEGTEAEVASWGR